MQNNPHFIPIKDRSTQELLEFKQRIMEAPSRWKLYPYTDIVKELNVRKYIHMT